MLSSITPEFIAKTSISPVVGTAHHRTMPRAAKKLGKTRSMPAPILPRRQSDADRRKTRRAQMGLPGPIDRWLTANRAREIGQPDCPLSTDEVRCSVQMELKAGEVEGDFVDPDTYTLHLTITALHATGIPGSYIVFPRIVLETYLGWTSSVDAPEWSQWSPGRIVVFRQTKEELVQFFISVAPKEDDADVLAKGMESIHI